MDSIKVGDKVICIPYSQDMLDNYDCGTGTLEPGGGYVEGLEFIVTQIDYYSETDIIYFGGRVGNGVRLGFIEKIKRGKFKLKRKK